MERAFRLAGCTGLLGLGLLHVGVLLIASRAAGQTGGGYDVRRTTIDGGGATFSTGGALSLGGTIGQPDAGTLSGGAFVLQGGFWSAGVAAVTPTPTVSASPTRTASPVVTATRTATSTPTGPSPVTATATRSPSAPTPTPTPHGSVTKTSSPTVTPSATPTSSHVLVVNTTDDTDDVSCDQPHCSLREAINAANARQGPDAIHFNIPGGAPGCDASGVCTLAPSRLLPFLTDGNTIIDGFTQPGAAAGSAPVLKIVIDGQDNGAFSGLAVAGANAVIRGLVIQRFTPFSAIHIQGPAATGNRVESNFIGTDASGTVPRGNCSPPVSCAAVWVQDGAHDNTIGPDNLIAFNGQGVWMTDPGTRGNTITRNRIHSNAVAGIRLVEGANDELAAPLIAAAGSTQVSGSACAGCDIEVFSDAEDEGAIFEGTTTADSAGRWSFAAPGGFSGPNLTATATDVVGNTSAFSAAVAVTACAGDCNGDGAVTINELLTMVNVALGTTAVTACEAGDVNGNGEITINEILAAVNHALGTCA